MAALAAYKHKCYDVNVNFITMLAHHAYVQLGDCYYETALEAFGRI
jgi:hypothetical protein